jgi:hypothetical protein
MDGTKRTCVLLLLAAAALGAGKPEPVDHSVLDAVLRRHVREGRVDYAELRKDARLGRYVESLARAEVPAALPARLALYLNAYNACALKAVADHPNAARVTEIEGFFDRLTVVLAGRSHTLDALESDLLRPLGDPRLRSALACGALGGAALRSEAYDALRIEAQLDDQARRFVGDPTKVRLDRAAGKLSLSPLLRWYEPDFEAGGGPAAFVRRHLVAPADQDWVAAGGYELAWLPFDWSVNGR